MLHSRIARGAFAALAVLACSQALAAGSGTLSVSASVSGVCKIITVPSVSLTIDPSVASPADVTAPSAVTYKCTKNTAPTSVTVGGVASPYSGTLVSTGTIADTMPFSVSWTNPTTPGSGFGTGVTAVSFNLTVTVKATDYVNAVAHSDYAATATVAINP